MADSVGAGFPRTSIQEGHLHFNLNMNILYVYNGGDPYNDANWSQVGGNGSSVGAPVAGNALIIDRGPQAQLVLTGGIDIIPNIAVTVSGAGGTVRIRGCSHMRNGEAAIASGLILYIYKDGVAMLNAFREVRAPALTWIFNSVEIIDTAAAIGSVYTLRAAALATGAAITIESAPSPQASLEVESYTAGMILTGSGTS